MRVYNNTAEFNARAAITSVPQAGLHDVLLRLRRTEIHVQAQQGNSFSVLMGYLSPLLF